MPKPIRVLHVLGSLNAGGAESRVMDIYRHINRNEVQFDFAIHTSKKSFFTEEVLELGARIFILPKFKGLNYLEYKTAWKSLLKNNRDITIIHGHMTTTAFIYLNIAKKMGIKKRIAHARNSNKDSYVKKLLSKLARFYATDLFAVSKEAAVSEFGPKLLKQKVRILPNLIAYTKYSFSSELRHSMRLELGILDQSVIIHIGRFHKQKNHIFLIKLFSEYLKINPTAILIMVGDGDLLDEIKQKCRNLGIIEQTIFLSNRSDIAGLLSASDCMVFPSLYEGLPGSLLEAQINNLPVITSDNVTKEVIISDRIAYINLAADEKKWINKIEYYLKLKRVPVKSKIINQRFSVTSSIKHIEKLYLQ